MDENQELTNVEPGVEQQVVAEPTHSETGASEVVTTEDQPTDRVETAFAKRLAAERAKMEQEYAERYKDYDALKEVGEYFREANGVDDVMSLKEQIELEKLQARAEKSQVSPEVQRRLEELESKAAEGEKLKQEQEIRQWYSEFRGGLDKFAAEKGVKADELESFMSENKIGNMEIAYKAMAFADSEAKKEQIEKEAVAKYLQSKKAPKTEGAGTAGHIPPSTPKTWAEAQAGAKQMLADWRKTL